MRMSVAARLVAVQGYCYAKLVLVLVVRLGLAV